VTAVSDSGDPHTRPSEEIIYETAIREPFREIDDDYEDEFLVEDARSMVEKTKTP